MQQRLAQNQLDFLRPMVVRAFEVFGFPIDSKPTPKMIKKKYRELAREHHPDKGGDEKTMKEITAAYELLIGKGKIKLPAPIRQRQTQRTVFRVYVGGYSCSYNGTTTTTAGTGTDFW